ncbi:MAG: hypothetical protein PVH38_03175 [Gammaproteobacteria bacterium]|jgi:hypothetical protein
MHRFLTTIDNTIIRDGIAILVILFFSLLLAHFLTPFGSATTPDSLNYLDIARNFKSGHGLLATDRSLENYDASLYREVRLWPPLYPLTLAASAFKLPDVVTASRLSALLLALTAVFAYLLLAPLMQWYFALLASILLCLSAPLITVYTYAWSETLFIPLLLLAVWASTRYLEAEAVAAGRGYRYLGVLVISLVALAYTRYIGIALSLLLPATFLLCRKKRSALPAFVIAAGVYAAAVGYLLASNYRVTGSITGGVRSPSDITFRDNLFDMLSALDASIPAAPLVQLLVLVAAMCIALVYARLATARVQPQPVAYRPARNILLFVGVLYLGVIFLLRMYRSFDMLDMRLLAPALVVLWLLMLVVLAQLKPVTIMRLVAQILLWFCVLVFPVKGYTRFQDSIHSWRVLGSPDHRANAGVSYMNYTSTQQASPARELLAGLLSGDAVVVTERPLIFEFMSGKRSLQLPETIDIDVIDKFNALPDGSLILLPGDRQQKGLLQLRLEHNLSYEYLKLGQGIAVRTPIVFASED